MESAQGYEEQAMKLCDVRVQPSAALVVPTGTIGRGAVVAVEEGIKQLPQLHIEPIHDYAPGVYARRITIPAGTVLAGKIHRFEHFNIVLRGRIEVLTEQGVKIIDGPAMFKSPPGTKRVGYTYTETEWITIHPNPDDLRDAHELEEIMTADDYEQLKESVLEGELIE